MAQGFSHPNFGHQVRVEQHGREVRVILVADTAMQAVDLTDQLLGQVRAGALHITLMGKPVRITETTI